LRQHLQSANHIGPQWGITGDDLNATLLSWPRGHEIAAHVNSEVDVILVGVQGEGEVRVNDETFTLSSGCALLIPKDRERSFRALSESWSYFSIHRVRAGLQIEIR
jgi:quercetin dioxygenase-like cupin family protein